MKNYLFNCLDFIITAFILFVFCVCIIVAVAVCYVFPNIGIAAGCIALVITIIMSVVNKKHKK